MGILTFVSAHLRNSESARANEIDAHIYESSIAPGHKVTGTEYHVLMSKLIGNRGVIE